jgi:hypothetical protein
MADHRQALRDLGHAEVDLETLGHIVEKAVGGPVSEVAELEVSPVDYPVFSIATGSLLRVQGTARVDGDARTFAIFVKQLQHASVWPMLHVVPEHLRHHWVSSFPWRVEIDAFTGPLADVLPDGMRLPRLYEVVEIDDVRAAIWMEDVDADPASWSIDQYARAAFLLGQLAGRRPVGSPTALGTPETSRPPGLAMRMYAGGRLYHQCVPILSDDRLWSYPPLVAALAAAGESTALRADLLAASARLDEWLDLADTLPQTLVHGDASPQNLLVPRDDPSTLVAIDWGFNSPHAVGFDLGQLILGLANADLVPPAMLPAIHAAIVPAYAEGLATTDVVATLDEIRDGYVATVLARSLFTTVPLDAIVAGAHPTSDHLARRVAMARFLLDLAAEV